MEAEWLRGSRSVLRGARGEVPLVYSPKMCCFTLGIASFIKMGQPGLDT